MSKASTLDFIGIGAEKSGSTWLATCLQEHPEICFPQKKELFFFNNRDPRSLTHDNPKYHWGIDWYESQFSNCRDGLIRGEFSPTYMYGSVAVKRIKRYSANIKLLVILRNPTERAFSQFTQDTQIGFIRNLTFEEALERHSYYFEKGLYYKHLKLYFKMFPIKNIIVVTLDDVKKNPGGEIKKLYGFLGLKNVGFVPPSLNKKQNVASIAKFPLLNYSLQETLRFLESRSHSSLILKLLEKTRIRDLAYLFSRNINKKKTNHKEQLAENTSSKLRKSYKSDINKLEKLIDRDLSDWK